MVDHSDHSDYSNLPPDIKAHALVGRHFQVFAYLEGAINSAIGKGLGLEILQTLVICTNMNVRNKLYILNTLVDLSFIPEADKSEYKRTINRIADKIVPERNTLAHHPFYESADGAGVVISVVKARNKIDMPKTVWSEDDFDKRIDDMLEATVVMAKLEDALQSAKTTQLLAAALSAGMKAGPSILSSTTVPAIGAWFGDHTGDLSED